jgi:hypothetical protein
MGQSPVFEETYRKYLLEIEKTDYLSRSTLLGVGISNNALEIPLYDRLYRVGSKGIEDWGGNPVTPAVRVILCKYVLMCPVALPRLTDRLMTYREFKNAGPLISYFTTNTNKTIETTFSGKRDVFQERSQQLGGTVRDDQSYDLSVEFFALPRIPVIVNFNDRDDLFPATCSILYRASAEIYLDMECLAMTGTLLAGKLISPSQGG